MTTLQSPVIDFLDQHNITYEIVEIPLTEDKKPVRNLEALLSQQGLDPKSVVRSILFKGGSKQFYLLAVAGGGRADWGVLRKQLDERKLRMAEFAEVSETTGYVVGAVPPIALPDAIPTLVDNGVKAYPKVVIGSGVLGYALALQSSDLVKVMLNVTAGDFVKAE